MRRLLIFLGQVAFVVVGFVVICYVGNSVLLLFKPNIEDARESERVVEAMMSRYHFQNDSRNNSRDAPFSLYCAPRRGYTELFVSGKTSRKEQDEICAIVQTVRREVAAKPIYLYFNLGEGGSGKLLRKEIFK